jgi:predicted CXXCH cytochrome family protein
MPPIGGPALLLAAGVTASAALAAARWERAQRYEADQAEVAKRLPRIGRPGGYVSSDACRSCHPAEYASWHRSYHRTMTQIATPETVKAPFDGQTLVFGGERYAVERSGDEFWMDVPELDAGGTGARARLRVFMVTGSHNMQAFWFHTPTDNRLYIAPLTYLLADQRWVPRRDVFLTPPLAPGEHPGNQVWNVGCIQCHSTAPQPRTRRDLVSGVAYSDSRLAELGVACEACHGPGERHVAANQDPLRRYAQHLRGGPDPTIVNPARLSAEASGRICGACHAVYRHLDVADYFENGHAFRPGQATDPARALLLPARWDAAVRDAVLAEEPHFVEYFYWPDGRIRVSGRDFGNLVESRCWQGGRLACTSCHSMHESDPDDQLAAGKDGDAACLPCHAELGKDVSAHTRHPATSSGSRCLNCHMPYTTYGLLKAIRSHTIASPSARESLELGRPNACNLCHLDRTLGWTAAELTARFGAPPVAVPDEPVAAALTWLLRGDAGQRALVAWSFGWAPAEEASGRDWMAPFLAFLLDDPYAAVRYVAKESLRRLPGWEQPGYDYLGPGDGTRARILERYAAHPAAPGRPELLLEPDGALALARIQALLRARDDRRVDLRE